MNGSKAWCAVVALLVVLLGSCSDKSASLTLTNRFPNDISELTYNGAHYAPALAQGESYEFDIDEHNTGFHKIYFRDVGTGDHMETEDLVYTEPGGTTRYDITPGSSVVAW